MEPARPSGDTNVCQSVNSHGLGRPSVLLSVLRDCDLPYMDMRDCVVCFYGSGVCVEYMRNG